MSNILIIGYGVVGHNVHKIFTEADIYDPDKGYNNFKDNYDIAIVCVPTPKLDSGACDISIVESVIAKHNPVVFHLRSTVPPGTTKMLAEKYNKKIVFSPEYYGETRHANAIQHNFLTLGCVNRNSFDGALVASIYKDKYPADFEFVFTDSTYAEMAKYMENCGLAMMVSFVNEIANICEKTEIEFDEVRELWLKDKRFSRYHTAVFKDKPGWKSICFDKDVPALISYAYSLGASTPMLDAVMRYKRE